MSSANDGTSASSAAPDKPTTAEKISVLCRIFRAAAKSGDVELRATAARELAEYGVQLGDIATVSSVAPECSSCRFWDRNTNQVSEEVGICRRYPPSIPPLQRSEDCETFAVWPLTVDSEWCGEHKLKNGDSR